MLNQPKRKLNKVTDPLSLPVKKGAHVIVTAQDYAVTP
jgi:hypothetical protein